MSDRGFIQVPRDIFVDPLMVDPVRFRAWIWLLTEAAWKPRRVTVTTGRSEVAIELDRGQLSYSLTYLAAAWNIGVQQVRTILQQFVDTGLIRIRTGKIDGTQSNTQSTRKPDTQTNTRTGQLPTLITICNYSGFQFVLDDAGLSANTQTNTHGNSETNNKHRNKELEERICAPAASAEAAPNWPADAFAQWYGLYPKKKAPKAAEKAFAKVRQSGEIDLEGLLAATRRHAAAMRTVEPNYIPYPATWLNRGSYLDEDDKPTQQQLIAAPERDPRTFSDEEWRDRLNASQWPEEHWGPKPGSPHCLVPRHLLEPRIGSQPGKLRVVRP